MNFESEEEAYNNRFVFISDGEDDLSNELGKLHITEPPFKVIMSIDIGLKNLGISVSLIDKNYDLQEIVWINLINITEFDCKTGCNLYHEKTFADWVSHFFAQEMEFLEWADVILIERQPPTGLTAVEQLIFYEFREKAVLIAPNSVHKYFRIGSYDYEQRKVLSERIGRKYLQKGLLEQLYFYHRQHDITDSILFTLFWCHQQKEKLRQEEMVKRQEKMLKRQAEALIKIQGKKFTMKDYFNGFRYIPPIEKIES